MDAKILAQNDRDQAAPIIADAVQKLQELGL